MRRPIVIAFSVLVLSALGVGSYFVFRGEKDEDALVKGHPAFMEELAAKRDHVRLVISGRLMAEIFACG